ncbi:outer dynein arm-docking complex subunit 4-like [Clytia hemisphaerica]|uniref:Outer dynein arm-docking complex subunit 4 n=1 Tax=Clytia hemisphaerica TaxID=252671 RepID=A0A7M5V2Q5_9CNID
MPAESYDDDEDEIEGPKSSFGTYLAEGDALFKQSEFKKALESYSLALEIEPEDKNCLVARSKCYLKLGDPQKALQDAEEALKEDKEFNRGLYRKAEALYSMGDFEYALMYYHRGHHLRPELDEFRLGIQKAQEAIDNSIGNAANVKLENKGDLSFFNRQDDLGSKKRGGYNKPARNLKLKPVIVNRNKEVKPPAPSKKTVKQLLGELYADKEYMEKLMNDDEFIKSHSNKPVYDLVQSGLTYLDTRTEFWRQQRPLYARRKDNGKTSPSKKKKPKQSFGKQVLIQLEEVDQALANGDAERSLKLAQALMKTVEEADPASLPNKNDVIANIHSCIGNAYVEIESFTKALKHHQKDLEISKKSKSTEGVSRGLDNVGRVYARMGDYEKAVRSWNEKLPMVKTPLETTWIFHEIGRCYLELSKHKKAKDCGLKSLEAAIEFEDEVWQLNASVLVVQAHVKLGEFTYGLDKFEEAHNLAVSLSDDAAQSAITKAIADLKERIERALTTDEEQPSRTTTSDSDGGDSQTSDKGETSDLDETEDDLTPRVANKDSDYELDSDRDSPTEDVSKDTTREDTTSETEDVSKEQSKDTISSDHETTTTSETEDVSKTGGKTTTSDQDGSNSETEDVSKTSDTETTSKNKSKDTSDDHDTTSDTASVRDDEKTDVDNYDDEDFEEDDPDVTKDEGTTEDDEVLTPRDSDADGGKQESNSEVTPQGSDSETTKDTGGTDDEKADTTEISSISNTETGQVSTLQSDDAKDKEGEDDTEKDVDGAGDDTLDEVTPRNSDVEEDLSEQEEIRPRKTPTPEVKEDSKPNLVDDSRTDVDVNESKIDQVEDSDSKGSDVSLKEKASEDSTEANEDVDENKVDGVGEDKKASPEPSNESLPKDEAETLKADENVNDKDDESRSDSPVTESENVKPKDVENKDNQEKEDSDKNEEKKTDESEVTNEKVEKETTQVKSESNEKLDESTSNDAKNDDADDIKNSSKPDNNGSKDNRHGNEETDQQNEDSTSPVNHAETDKKDAGVNEEENDKKSSSEKLKNDDDGK